LKNDILLNPKEVALRLFVSESTARRLIDQCHFKVAKVGRSVRVWASSVEDYLERQAALWAAENGEE